MSERDKTFGSAISNVRKKNRLSLKDLSSRISTRRRTSYLATVSE